MFAGHVSCGTDAIEGRMICRLTGLFCESSAAVDCRTCRIPMLVTLQSIRDIIAADNGVE